ncbi:hypothetical protein SERLA73DRAFT_154401 [Serpula lacrymans var. lacrymans S7.3]|uniref:Uncharacterized protein n=1 Tax=Serpula lacrymans var. lacrymans (strain S7.3) TaxID=936435 RepID=F8Q4K1_SERL3|nr:hypothetical protein SERLA73DRAFT_154401 [Serpula lacrymans var. lacrymans S7.3]
MSNFPPVLKPNFFGFDGTNGGGANFSGTAAAFPNYQTVTTQLAQLNHTQQKALSEKETLVNEIQTLVKEQKTYIIERQELLAGGQVISFGNWELLDARQAYLQEINYLMAIIKLLKEEKSVSLRH